MNISVNNNKVMYTTAWKHILMGHIKNTTATLIFIGLNKTTQNAWTPQEGSTRKDKW
jgi:hypothetical protein